MLNFLYKTAEEMKAGGSFVSYKGHSIFFNQIGKGKDLLLLHGYPFNSFDWNYILPEFSKEYRITYLDFLGMGFSSKPQEHVYSFAEYVDIVQTILFQLKIPSVHIFAHDLGVSVVQEMIVKEDTLGFKIESIAFMNGGLFTDVYRPRFIQRLLSQTPNFFGKWMSSKISRKSIESSLFSVFGPETQPEQSLLDEYWKILNEGDGKAIAYRIGRLVFEKVKYQKRWIEALHKTKIPFCYICGPFDPNSGIHMAERFRKEYSKASVYYLSEKIGHWPQVEAPNEVIQTYKLFLNEILRKEG
ncbi:hydrolase [Leptospira ryugenii]|uniref:Hydrolase n=1 Tax=Leptospira ryugenii TaxID=1917863 RepID=A0A2P2DZ27_9LEPT|nr:alpha/beta hydrolase [Leptospira ryugenii]GBF49888.1 hydrolase [Leptospira ryugenii]